MANIALKDLLYDMQTYTDEAGEYFPQVKHLSPSDDQIVDIDLNSREINAPKFLSVQYDHNAEIIYFRCNRYFDNMDLARTVCVIQYLNAEHIETDEGSPNFGEKTRDAGIFWVPYYDIDHTVTHYTSETEGVTEPTLLIPWSIGGLATAYEGTVTYSVRFYRLANDNDKTYLYNMSTKPAQGEVLYGLDFALYDEQHDEEEQEFMNSFQYESTFSDQVYHNLSLAVHEAATYWVDA